METRDNGVRNQDDDQSQKNRYSFTESENETSGNGTNDKTSDTKALNDDQEEISEENREARRHHQEHGNRKYKMFSNHSSADDQPLTNTDTTP